MDQTVTIPSGRLAYLEERAAKLAREKSEMQLIMHLINRISALPGLDNLIHNLLQSIVEVIGGDNLILYYRVDDELFYADLLGVCKKLEQFDDEQARQVFESGTPLEVTSSFSETRMLTTEFSAAFTWMYPLVVNQESVGVLKMENLHISMQEMYPQFPAFFRYTALLLKNEIEGHSRLKQAYNRLSDMNAELEAEIDERQRAEQALLSARDQLEDTVRERTEALAREHAELQRLNATLEQRVQEEVEKNREQERIISHQARLAAMGEMLSNIAHQWRQPLNNLGLYMQNLQLDYQDSQLDDERVAEYVGNVMETIQYMSRTISDFQNFFKPDREKKRFVIAEALKQAVKLVEASLQTKGITVTVDAGGGCAVLGFPNEFSQVVLNIINNARDVLLDRRVPDPVIRIVCRCAGETAVVTIEDNAGGIPEELLDKVFDPYFTTKDKTQGTGLGLYMAKMILSKGMGGHLQARNAGNGAEFVMKIPIAPPSEEGGKLSG